MFARFLTDYSFDTMTRTSRLFPGDDQIDEESSEFPALSTARNFTFSDVVELTFVRTSDPELQDETLANMIFGNITKMVNSDLQKMIIDSQNSDLTFCEVLMLTAKSIDEQAALYRGRTFELMVLSPLENLDFLRYLGQYQFEYFKMTHRFERFRNRYELVLCFTPKPLDDEEAFRVFIAEFNDEELMQLARALRDNQ